MTKDVSTLRVYRLKTLVTAVSTDESDSAIHSQTYSLWGSLGLRVKEKTNSKEQTEKDSFFFLYVNSCINQTARLPTNRCVETKDKLDYYIWDVLDNVDKRLIYAADENTKEYRFLIYTSIC